MRYVIDKEKRAIKDMTVFDGLAVDDRDKFRDLFLMPQFNLLEVYEGARLIGYVVYEITEFAFHYHLVNFTSEKSLTMTEAVNLEFTIPYCERAGIRQIRANVERLGMARKLEKLDFKRDGKSHYVRGV